MNKRISAFLLAALMIMALVPSAAFATGPVVAKIGTTEYTDLHDAMVACKSGETVELVSDVDLAGANWEPVSFAGTFDGKGFAIKNLTISKPGVSSTGFITSLNGTFMNVTFTNPTVTGGENTGVVAGRCGGSGALAKNITVNGTIKVEATHSGYARVGTIVGGWGYGRYENITVDGGDPATSYLKHTGGGDGRYVAGIVGHADNVDAYVNCTVKNITIDGDWLCGGIAGPGPADGLASGCVVENINIHADYSGGMFGWYYSSDDNKAAVIENCEVTDVTFTAGGTCNGQIGGYTENPEGENVTITNVKISNVKNSDGRELIVDDAATQVPPPAYAGPVMNWVKVNTADNGVVKSGPLAASAGATVTLYPKAADGFVLDTIEVLDAEGNAVVLDGLKFALPAGGVTVNATFKAAQ